MAAPRWLRRSPSPRPRIACVYQRSVRLLSLLFVALGGVLLVTTIVAGGGPASVGFLMGIAFLAVGAGRLWLAARMGR